MLDILRATFTGGYVAALIALHVVGAMAWVGGLVWVAMLRFSRAAPEPVLRTALWRDVLAGVFGLGGLAAVMALATGILMTRAYRSPTTAPPHVQLMMACGVAAMALFAYAYAGPWRRIRRATNRPHTLDQAIARLRLAFGAAAMLALIAAAAGAAGPFL